MKYTKRCLHGSERPTASAAPEFRDGELVGALRLVLECGRHRGELPADLDAAGRA